MKGEKNRITAIVAGMLMLIIFAGPIHPADRNNEGMKRFQLEVFSGYSFMIPEHLNQRPAYDDNNEIFRYAQQYLYLNNRLGGNYSYSIQSDGEFNKIENGIPFGGRIKFSLNRLLAVSLGLTYLDRTATSHVIRDYGYEGIYVDDVTFYDAKTYHREFAPYAIHMRNIASLVGIHFRFGDQSNLQFEIYAAGGPLFSACDITYQLNHEQMDYRGYGIEIQDVLNMEGSGTGYSIDFGLRGNIRLFGPLGLFVEAGYSVQRVKELSGEGNALYSRKDTNADGYTIQYQWNGKWYRTNGTLNQNWGSYSYRYPVNWDDGREHDDFILNLSGLRLRLGLSIQLF